MFARKRLLGVVHKRREFFVIISILCHRSYQPDLVRGKQWEEIGRRVLLATSIVQSRKSTMSRDSTYVH